MEPDFTIKLLRPGDEAALEGFLLPRLENSMFLIGNMRAAGLLDGGQRLQGSYAAAVQAGRFVGVVAHFWNQNLVLQVPEVSQIPALCAAAVAGSGRPVKGVIGPGRQVSAALAALDADPAVVQMDETEKLYSLALRELVVPEALACGRLRGRLAQIGDLPLLASWRVGYAIEAMGETASPQLEANSRETAERSLQDGQTWLVEADGRPVACSSFNAAIKEAVQVGGVWTPPELRGRGYARAAVAASLLDARAEGVEQAILFTGEENIPAQKAYQALGFRQIGDYRIVLLRSAIGQDGLPGGKR